ncbi:MAG: NAD/NADP octopine/nopaline dehydrogenase family protein [Muribaculaceae bacterium]|nr:NAD/NADP octopine/nopaline dehydrogenase family protein [Muribaculaceae bacterium]
MKRDQKVTRVCVCGGGSQGHVAAGMIGCREGYAVDILTRRPDDWSHDFVTRDFRGKEYRAHLGVISSDPADVIPQADIIYISLPGFAIREQMARIKPYLRPDTIIGSSFGGSGFFIHLFHTLGYNVPSFCFQRVPAIGRPLHYGHIADLQGYKPDLKVATVNISDPERIVKMSEEWFETPTTHLSHWLEVTLSNSNPLLHPVSLSVLFADWEPGKIYRTVPEVYSDWTDEASRRWLACDDELQSIIRKLPMRADEVPTLLDYYGVDGVESLTAKVRSIEAFKNKPAPMKAVGDGYVLDSGHRMFEEDVRCGLVTIKSFAERVGVSTPMIDRIICWAQRVMGKEYIVDGRLTGRDLGEALIAEDGPEE